MGLGGRRVKQRIGADPRNLAWADDAAKFGQSYLQKLGWDPSKGLGVSGDGRTSHLKVAQKLNLLGIGAGNAGETGDSTFAWKQNREYEMLLKRLNEGAAADEQGKDGEGSEDEKNETREEEGEGKKRKKRRKSDDAQIEVDEDDSKERKKRKKEKKGKKEELEAEKQKSGEMKQESGEKDETMTCKVESTVVEAPSSSPIIRAPTPRPMAHRARFLRSKQLASQSSTAVAEILGIPPTSVSISNSPAPSSAYASLGATPFPPDSESPTPGATSSTSTPIPETDQDIRTSTTSVNDYFKEKLAARALALARGKSNVPTKASSSSSALVPSPNSTDSLTAANTEFESGPEKDLDVPRSGLGSVTIFSLPASAKCDNGDNEGDAPRYGLGNGTKFGNLMGGFLSSSRSLVTTFEPNNGPCETSSELLPPDAASTVRANGDQLSKSSTNGEVSRAEKKEKKKGKKRKDADEVEVIEVAPKSTEEKDLRKKKKRKERKEKS